MAQVKILIDTGDSRLYTVENWIPPTTSKLVSDYIVIGGKLVLNLYPYLKTLPLEIEPLIKIYGREVHQRRDVGFFSNESIGYRYSGQIAKSQPLTPILSSLMSDVNSAFGTHFNGILVNRYSDGTKTISPHSDDEKALDKQRRSVIGIAYGATRTFRIRDKRSKEIVLDIQHTPGLVIVMDGNFQNLMTHEIKIEKKVTEERISCTMRAHLN